MDPKQALQKANDLLEARYDSYGYDVKDRWDGETPRATGRDYFGRPMRAEPEPYIFKDKAEAEKFYKQMARRGKISVGHRKPIKNQRGNEVEWVVMVQEALAESKNDAALKPLIAKLKKQMSSVDKIDPESDAYKKMIKFLDTTAKKTPEAMKLIADADIKFISSLAKNRIPKGKLNKKTLVPESIVDETYKYRNSGWEFKSDRRTDDSAKSTDKSSRSARVKKVKKSKFKKLATVTETLNNIRERFGLPPVAEAVGDTHDFKDIKAKIKTLKSRGFKIFAKEKMGFKIASAEKEHPTPTDITAVDVFVKSLKAKKLTGSHYDPGVTKYEIPYTSESGLESIVVIEVIRNSGDARPDKKLAKDAIGVYIMS